MTADTKSKLADLRMVVVSGHFSPEVGYQEVDLAAAATRLGATVRVVASTRVSRNARAAVGIPEYEVGTTSLGGYEIVRLKPRLSLGPNLFGCKALPPIREFTPDVVILVGPAKLFGIELFAQTTAPWQRIAIVQDNSDDGRAQDGPVWKRLPRSAFHRAVKRRVYRRVVRNADRIILNVPETREIVRPWLRRDEQATFDKKALDLRLGFDPETFLFDAAARRAWRKTHRIADDEVVLVTCTRATSDKRLERVVHTVSGLRSRGLDVRYTLAGVLDDDYGSTLRAHVARQPDPSAFLLLPMLQHEQMRELFSAADIGFWPRAAITIQQAMGTGLPVVLRKTANVSHLLRDGFNGWYVADGQSVDHVIGDAVASLRKAGTEERVSARESAARLSSSYLSYDRIVLEMLGGLWPGKTGHD